MSRRASCSTFPRPLQWFSGDVQRRDYAVPAGVQQSLAELKAVTFVAGRSLISSLRLPMDVLQRMTASSLLFTWTRWERFNGSFYKLISTAASLSGAPTNNILYTSSAKKIVAFIAIQLVFRLVYCGFTQRDVLVICAHSYNEGDNRSKTLQWTGAETSGFKKS